VCSESHNEQLMHLVTAEDVMAAQCLEWYWWLEGPHKSCATAALMAGHSRHLHHWSLLVLAVLVTTGTGSTGHYWYWQQSHYWYWQQRSLLVLAAEVTTGTGSRGHYWYWQQRSLLVLAAEVTQASMPAHPVTSITHN
jgi:hypothetical protein